VQRALTIGWSIIVVVLAACNSWPQAAAAAGPQTRQPQPGKMARAQIAEATAVATRWKADAFLIQVAGRNVDDEGRAFSWQYGFFSKTAQTCLVVTSGDLSQQESGGKICASPPLTEFIDSNQTIKIARSNGITHKSVSMVITVEPGKDPVWMVMDEAGLKPGNVMLDLDGRTGKVLGKRVQK
jgi:hypothetical protein